MPIQKELFRTSVLAKLAGCLVLIQIKVNKDSGKCPSCKETQFRRLDTGWTECINDDCDFQVLTAHLDEIKSQWN